MTQDSIESCGATVENESETLFARWRPPCPGHTQPWTDCHSSSLEVDPVEPSGATRRPPGMVDLRKGQAPAVWAGDGPLLLSTVVFNGSETAGSTLVESGLLQEGAVLS